jgi:hypothetical protein
MAKNINGVKSHEKNENNEMAAVMWRRRKMKMSICHGAMAAWRKMSPAIIGRRNQIMTSEGGRREIINRRMKAALGCAAHHHVLLAARRKRVALALGTAARVALACARKQPRRRRKNSSGCALARAAVK